MNKFILKKRKETLPLLHKQTNADTKITATPAKLQRFPKKEEQQECVKMSKHQTRRTRVEEEQEEMAVFCPAQTTTFVPSCLK